MSVNALIIVDVQRDFIDGSLAVDGGERVARDIREYLDDDAAYGHIAVTMDWHIDPGDHFSDSPDYVDSWPAHCVANTMGAALHPLIEGIDAPRFFKGQYAAAYSGFEGVIELGEGEDHRRVQSLGAWLLERGVTEVDVVGIATDYCVKATALHAAKVFNTAVLLPLTASVNPDPADALQEMSAAGIELRAELLMLKASITGAIIAAALAGAVVGCSSSPSTDDKGNATPDVIAPHYVNLPDGRTVLCVWESDFRKGGPSCDWNTAK